MIDVRNKKWPRRRPVRGGDRLRKPCGSSWPYRLPALLGIIRSFGFSKLLMMLHVVLDSDYVAGSRNINARGAVLPSMDPNAR